MQWKAQDETLKDFDILADDGNGFKQIITVEDNYQRQLEFNVNLKKIKKIRLQVNSTKGLDHARVFEIRCVKDR